ncbi:MAG: DNA topoisomerase (ATP-hydrolyzing) subunit B [Gracilibacteraceae bacterium]|nr:DNA topoisomerase (ATP-hydrolyzing) subunit B [Gracilibacteraceae bacterium]
MQKKIPDTVPDYNAGQIEVLEGLEAVRKRPGMYINTTGSKGLHHLVNEVVDNSIDEAMAGFCDDIQVTVRADGGVVVADNGRGIPVDIHPKYGISGVEVALTMLHAGGKFSNKMYSVSGGLHGVGVSVVNALSVRLEVRVRKEGRLYAQTFSRGKTLTPLRDEGEAPGRSGTTVTFWPDAEIFTETTEFDADILKTRLRELAFLTHNVTITLTDEREQPLRREEFAYSGGLTDYIAFLNRSKGVLHPVPVIHSLTRDDTLVEMALQYNDSFSENLFSYVNNIHTIEGGTHEAGFKAALTRSINDYARKAKLLKDNESNLSGEDVREGLTAILSLKIQDPQFEGQTKLKLGNSEARSIVDGVVGEALTTYFEENPSVARRIVEKGLQAARARMAAKKARELVQRKTALGSTSLPGTLSDCSWKDPAFCEIFLVEGKSAGGSAKQGRDSKFQAILPLKGKILNVEKARLDKMLANDEIRSMITVFGTGISDNFDIEKARYHKIVIMTDADVDGAHIRILLLTFFYRYMRPLLENNYIYIAQPPLFKISKGNTVRYAYEDAELERVLAEIGRERVTIQRYKGLGEMQAEQLWDTTMDPAKRTLLQVNIDDAIRADDLFTVLMGDQVEPRKEYIYAHAKEVTNLDI